MALENFETLYSRREYSNREGKDWQCSLDLYQEGRELVIQTCDPMSYDASVTLYLDLGQAKRLRDALNEFVEKECEVHAGRATDPAEGGGTVEATGQAEAHPEQAAASE